jgi:iron complex outermembrane recepter protein
MWEVTVGAVAGPSRGAPRRAIMLVTTAIAGWLLSSVPGWGQAPPNAQQAASSDDSPIENVIVSAQKRGVAENAQDVPIALTAINGVELDERFVVNLQDLTAAVPNVTLAAGGSSPGFAQFTIRGLGINSTIPSVEPAVGIFVDGVYLGVSAGAVLDLFDIEDIEILRGPQGLLFGRNTTGGAILINTRRPGDESRSTAASITKPGRKRPARLA